MKYLIINALIIFSVAFAGCFKNCKEVQYQFSMEESFSPESDSIQIGDTLWLNSFHSTNFTDLMTHAQVNFDNSNIGTNIRILKFPDSTQEVIGSVYDFKIITKTGNEAGNDNIPTENKGYYFEEINGNYLLSIGFVPTVKGIYSISVGNSLGIVQRKGGCEKASMEIINANLNNHLYYYQNFRPGYEISSYEKTHMYCFKVY